ncbi:LacI family DNA-binding transcriptional regulator [Herbiconiux ginsengi]|uniref:Transcriptional regulator, LacI family n=1 Tax=Herbiconiux ginsengi TaxID=381665 RepID=A0A1H3K8A1_9MICO|nr:LacI family DNA-binding transcriptional regulator [Herbiconiux ginsengi]SDY48426.1 transcriptional regulator, LacI family [Herbiconiux ginsengi]
MSGRRATRDDVARLAGTSTAVVSYVLNDGPRNVSAERRARVLDAVARLEYHPNAMARSLAATHTKTLGMIVPNISNAYFSELALAVEEAATTRGLLLFLGNSNEDVGREEAYVSSFLEQRVDGIVMIGVALSAAYEKATKAGIPVVIVDRNIPASKASTVSIDHRAASRAATEHLLGHGHTRIGCLAGPSDQPVAQDRFLGWQDALVSAGIEPSEQLVVRSEFSIGSAEEAIAAVGARVVPARSTAMIACSDEQARGLLLAIAAAGVRLPEDTALVSIDGTREGLYTMPSLTSVQQPFAGLATAALETLLDDDGGTGHTSVPFGFRTGASCGCLPGRSSSSYGRN